MKPFWATLLLVLSAPLALAEETTADQAFGAANTSWIMTATALVLFMTLPGLALFYGGLVHKKNVLSVLMHCFAMACILSVVWLVAGYSLALTSGNDWVGSLSAVFGKGLNGSDSGGSDIPDILTFAFQMTFFIITPALVVGTFVERVKFSAVMLFAVLWGLFCYAPVCNMVWNGGLMYNENTESGEVVSNWLMGENEGVIDLAGGIVVHITAGIAALIFCIMVGPRKETSPPHNLAMTVIGTCMLWVGWFGFNGGSGLAANGAGAMSIVVTHISAATAALTWMLIDVITTKKPTILGICTGAIAGLAAITPASGVSGPVGALIIGFASGAICWYFSIVIKNKLGYDDSLDVVGVHGVGGLVGTLLAAVVAVAALGGTENGAENYNMLAQLWTQTKGSIFTILFTVIVTTIILVIIKNTVGLRVDEAEESVGLDQSAHGETAYND
ncbi:MAG: ammonium transporter [Verrucomicrobiota bacterium]|nr:ammonium transporter [Verrucomicrobiota bacterium]MEC8692122.1 ammonium transporter [Verrucomicrobiota bacterium]